MYIESTQKKSEAGQSFNVQHEYLPCTNNCARHFLYKKNNLTYLLLVRSSNSSEGDR